MSFDAWLYLLSVCFLVSLSPGPAALSSVTQTLTYGLSRNLLNILGLQVALLIHLTMVVVGLSTVVLTSAAAFNAIKVAGAIYLAWLGVQKWLQAPGLKLNVKPGRNSALFREGLLINLTNPKSILFFTALLPQLIDPRSSTRPQSLIMAVTIVGIDALIMFGYSLFANSIRNFLNKEKFQLIINRVFGSLYIIFGGALLTTRR